jgi:hypothetical protein
VQQNQHANQYLPPIGASGGAMAESGGADYAGVRNETTSKCTPQVRTLMQGKGAVWELMAAMRSGGLSAVDERALPTV